MATEHTPRKWHIDGWYIVDEDGNSIAMLDSSTGSDHTNGPLIAAAPETRANLDALLEAARRIDSRRNHNVAIQIGDLDALRAAIDKASA